jgi:hypothetical protein
MQITTVINMAKRLFHRIPALLREERHIAPLVVLRIVFGAVLFASTVRFMAKGWVHDFYIAPQFHFPFYGFEWVKPLPAAGMYILFVLMALTSLGILTGLFYRVSATVFFLSFVYVELIDKTYYLNHYYFVSIFAFLLLLVPAHRYFSLDVIRRPSLKAVRVPGWTIGIFKWQLCLIYFCAGLSKVNHDWLVEAMPLKIWLPANGNLPVIGTFLKQTWVAYAFSWGGAFFDLSIGFLLLNRPTRKMAYVFVIFFHVLTGWLFQIGMFPYIMILVTIIFFSEDFHRKLIRAMGKLFHWKPSDGGKKSLRLNLSPARKKLLYPLLAVYILLQLWLPFRYLLYPGRLFWTEEGYRFSWRVMLMEKGGTDFFYVTDRKTGRRDEVINSQFLTPLQEKMMSTQPDMILQFAHILKKIYLQKGIQDPAVTVQSYVTLNGSGSRLFIDSTVDLSREEESFRPKKWILPFDQDK